jgi:hypothetical protein
MAGQVEAVDVLGDDDGIIDQHADGDDEGENGQDVERLADEKHGGEGDQQGNRDGKRDDDGEPDASEEPKKDAGGEGGADEPAGDEVVERFLHHPPLVEEHFGVHAGKPRIPAQPLEFRLDPAGDLDGIGLPCQGRNESGGIVAV